MTTTTDKAPTVPLNATTKTALTVLATFFDTLSAKRHELAEQLRADEDVSYPEHNAIADTLLNAANTTWELIGGRPNDPTDAYVTRQHFVNISAKELGKLFIAVESASADRISALETALGDARAACDTLRHERDVAELERDQARQLAHEAKTRADRTAVGHESLLVVGESCWPRISARRAHLIIRDLERGLTPAESVELYTLERVRRARSELASALLTLRMGTLDDIAEVLGSVVQSPAWAEQEHGLFGTGLAEELETTVDDRRRTLNEKLATVSLEPNEWQQLSHLNAVSRRLFVTHFAMRELEQPVVHTSSATQTAYEVEATCKARLDEPSPKGRMFVGLTFERECPDGRRETIDPSEVRVMVGDDPTPLVLVGKPGPR